MNDFSELERELEKLRPRAVSSELLGRIEAALTEEEKIIRPDRFKMNWLGLGLGLAAAAGFILMARVDLQPRKIAPASVAATERTAPAIPAAALGNKDYRTTGLTQVVYGRRDEGLVFPEGGATPARRLRTSRRETLHWQDPATGAHLRVSYPTEEVTITPVSGQ